MMHTPDSSRLRKMERLARGERPRVVDLFSGCGGISLGFKAAGFEIVANVEIDSFAAATHARNFHPDQQDLYGRIRDMTKLEPEDLMQEIAPNADAASIVDIVVGGPPCQAFARVGRAKLREVHEHPEAFRQDPRGNLYLRYLHYVKQLKPLALLMENVPDVLNYGGHNIPEEMAEVLEELGYECRYTLLNASYYGVPQMRERLFMIGIAKELTAEPAFPSCSHWVQLPQGYSNSRKVALQSLGQPTLWERYHYVAPPIPELAACKFVSAEEAIGDLPRVTAHLEGKGARGPRRLDKLLPYDRQALTDYARLMRNWPGFESHEGIYDHVIRTLPRDYAIFRDMKPGDQYPQAHRVAVNLFQKKLATYSAADESIAEGSDRWQELWAQTVPPYDPGKFPNKWRKMEADLPARTLMAHLGKDGYSHIHYDSSQARTISVREAARLQSFPDGFRFCGAMNPAFRQIGNAVPALLARALADTLRGTLEKAIGTTLVRSTTESA